MAENESGRGKNMIKCEEIINHFVGKKEKVIALYRIWLK